MSNVNAIRSQDRRFGFSVLHRRPRLPTGLFGTRTGQPGRWRCLPMTSLPSSRRQTGHQPRPSVLPLPAYGGGRLQSDRRVGIVPRSPRTRTNPRRRPLARTKSPMTRTRLFPDVIGETDARPAAPAACTIEPGRTDGTNEWPRDTSKPEPAVAAAPARSWGGHDPPPRITPAPAGTAASGAFGPARCTEHRKHSHVGCRLEG